VSQLFIELYRDEDVNVLVAALIQARGFRASTTREAGMLHSSDADQLAHAAHQNKALVTHNRADFEELARNYFTAGRTHAGIIIAVRRLPSTAGDR
jgi:hypothetical protein